MRCIGDGVETEQEFFESLVGRVSMCRGPLIRIFFTSKILEYVLFSLSHTGDDGDILSCWQTKDPEVFEACAAHWYDMTQLLSGIARAEDDNMTKAISDTLFVLVSEQAGWDYREIFNRFVSHYSVARNERLPRHD